MTLPSTPLGTGNEPRPRTIVVRYEHEIDALDRVAGILRRQRVRAEAFTAVASHDRAKTAILMVKRKLGRAQAEQLIVKCDGSLRKALVADLTS